MIAHPDAEASRYPPQDNRNEESFPSKEEQRRKSAKVKGCHKKCGYPVDLVVGRLFSFDCLKLHHWLISHSSFDVGVWRSVPTRDVIDL
jgi:hypothetical protein